MIYKKHKYFNMNITEDSDVKTQNAYFYNCCFDETIKLHIFKDCIFDNCRTANNEIVVHGECFSIHKPYTLLRKTKRQKAAYFSKDMNQDVYLIGEKE